MLTRISLLLQCTKLTLKLKLKGNIKALDCTGKIRFPHIITSASELLLTQGSSFLHMYYIDLSL